MGCSIAHHVPHRDICPIHPTCPSDTEPPPMEKLTFQIRIASSKEDKKLADRMVIEHHSYVASPRTVGRCLKYIITYKDQDIGTFWIGSGFKPTPKSILTYMKLSQKEYDKIFNEVADNKRFCMIKRIPNLGSQILKAIRLRAKEDWKNIYGNELKAILTTIGEGKNGAVYLADNWTFIGETAGLPKNRKSVSMKWDSKESIQDKYVKPTGENRKRILITDRV